MKKYHKDVGFPSWFKHPQGNVVLDMSRHAFEQCYADRHGSVKPFNVINLTSADVIEIETEHQIVTKYVLRIEYDDHRDVIYTVVPGNKWRVKTVWVNMKNDNHKTLNRDVYDKPW